MQLRIPLGICMKETGHILNFIWSVDVGHMCEIHKVEKIKTDCIAWIRSHHHHLQ